MNSTAAESVFNELQGIQSRLCAGLEAVDGSKTFLRDAWERAPGDASGLTGHGMTAVLEGGAVLERAGVALSDVSGSQLPPAATARNPQLAGRGFRAMGVSVVIHPRNPQVPTSHMNVRYFSAGDVWWFGGGFDLTPYIPYDEDIVAWHRAAATACADAAPGFHAHARRDCDEYFHLKHRAEARGVGGIFYDDLNEATPQFGMSWERCFALLSAVANGFQQCYLDIVQRRRNVATNERERRYQLYRRGRYVEFNLVFDRGTLFGLQSGGRTDAILVSMPPQVEWRYRSPDADMDARLLPYLTTLRGKDWLA